MNPNFPPPRRHQLSFCAALGAALAAGLAAAAWSALVLAECGRFAAPLPLLAFPLAAALTFALLHGAGAPRERPAALALDLLAVGIAAATLWCSIPADEQVLGGQDPGVYVHTAAALARTGSLVFDEPDLAAQTQEERQLLTRQAPGVTEPFTGVYLRPDGRVSPQFYHLFPSLMAVAWSVGGIRAALLVNPLLNVAAILALYALAALLLGRPWALAAALVHALAAAQLRQAKFPTAELLTQFFLLAGVAALALALREADPPRALAPLSGALLGMAILTRYDTILFLIPLAAVLLWGMAAAGRVRTVAAALATLALFAAQSWLHQRAFSPFYRPLGGLVAGFLAAALLLIAAVPLLRRTGAWQRVAAAVLRRETALRAAAAALLCGWVLFGWFVRPGLAGPGLAGRLFRRLVGGAPHAGLAQLLAGPESGNVLYLVDLLGAAGLLAALGGIAWLLLSRRRLWENAWLAASLAVLAVFTLDVFHDHVLMWVSRRFVPVVTPLASIGIAAAGAWVARPRAGCPQACAWAGIALVAAVLWLNAGATGAMARGREWPGLIAWYERLEAALPRDAEIYCDQPGFAAPLRFLSGRRAYELQSPSAERVARLIALMRAKAAAGRQVLYLSQRRVEGAAAAGLVGVGAYPLRSSVLAVVRRGVPAARQPRGADFVLYRVQPS
jgi:hypothetical protein